MGQMFLYHLSSDGPGYFILSNGELLQPPPGIAIERGESTGQVPCLYRMSSTREALGHERPKRRDTQRSAGAGAHRSDAPILIIQTLGDELNGIFIGREKG